MNEQEKQLPSWAKELARVALAALLAFLAAKYGITPAVTLPVSQPAPLVVVVGGGQTQPIPVSLQGK